jgi:hypothetical protein
MLPWIVNDDVRRFWSKTEMIDGCIQWIGTKDKAGYGKFMTGPLRGQTTHRPHRWIYQRACGPLNGTFLLHSCDRPACVTLQHLSPGTQKQNIAECVARGRKNQFSILTETQVSEIKWLLANGHKGKDLARFYKISAVTIGAIAVGRNWPKVAPRKPSRTTRSKAFLSQDPPTKNAVRELRRRRSQRKVKP